MPRSHSSSYQRMYRFPSGVTLRLQTDQREVLGHLDAEYGSVTTEAPGEADIDVYAGQSAISSSAQDSEFNEAYEGRHKTVHWRVAVSSLQAETIRVLFEGRGQLVISFLQTFYIEPLLRLKFLKRGNALLHAACLAHGERSILFPAGSGVGKSTLMLRHAASGKRVQGDNYVILTGEGHTLAFPRRLRIYSDLAAVSPDIFGRLPPAERWRLRVAGLIRRFSLGYANLPRRLTIDEIVGPGRLCPEARLESVYFLKRHLDDGLAGPTPLSRDDAVSRIQAINRDEGKRLEEALERHSEATEAFKEADRLERCILESVLSDVPIFELLVPRVRNPSAVVAEISRVCGLGGVS